MPGDITKRVILQLSAKDDGVSDTMTKAASGTKKFSGSVGDLNSQLTGLRGTMGGIAQQFGAGGFGSLLGATTLVGATLAVTGIIAQAMRMAYVFEETSARVAANLSITGGSVSGAFNAVQAAALSSVPMRYGYSATQAVGTMAAYQTAAGAGLAGTTAALRPSLSFARATGMAPEEAGAAIGAVTRITQEDAGRAASSLYGGAGEAGQLGRDIRGFIATTQSVLTNLAMGAPGSPISVGRAAQMVADISRVGGIYSTQGGVQGVTSGLMSLTQGNQSDPMRLTTALAAGISRRDIILGEGKPQNQARMAEQIARMGGGWHSLTTDALMVNMMGQSQARMLLDMPDAARNKLLSDMRSGKAAPLGDTDKHAGDVMKTSFGETAQAIAKLDNSMVFMGKKTLDYWSNLLAKYPQLSDAAATTIQWLPAIGTGLGILAGGSFLKGLLRLGGGAAAEAAAGVEGTAAAAGVGLTTAVSAVAATLALSGDSGPNANAAVAREAMKWGATSLFANVLANFKGFSQFPITSLKRTWGDSGHLTGNAVDVGTPYNAAGLAYDRAAVASGKFQKIGVAGAWVSTLRQYAKSLGLNEFIFEDDPATGATGYHTHLEIDPAAYAKAMEANQSQKETMSVKGSDGKTHKVVITHKTHVQITPTPSPTTSASRTSGLGAGASGHW